MATPTKKLLNQVCDCVDENLKGIVALNPGLQILEGHKVIVRADIEEVKAKGKVTLLSGGGSGHEPAHAGYVGPGMLSAAVAGAVFTSPPPASILAAIRAIGSNNPAGTLLIIKNYTGDRLNFGLAAEQAKGEGLRVEMVVVGEDCALTSADKTAGRRGLCGTVFIHKIAGALAEEGRGLREITEICRAAASSMGTIGLSLSPCSVPGCGPSFTLAPNEMELGLGIHGEAGVRRLEMLSAKDSVAEMFNHMTNISSTTHLPIKSGDHVALMINNLGGTSVLEMNIVAHEAIQWLEQYGVSVDRAYMGSYMTSLEMAGLSFTVMFLDDTKRCCLDAPVEALAWNRPLLMRGQKDRNTPPMRPAEAAPDSNEVEIRGVAVSPDIMKLIHTCITSACKEIIAQEAKLNELDRAGGDGDCGTTHSRGANALLKLISHSDAPCPQMSYPQALLLAIASSVSRDMGGSSGALYSLFFTSAAAQFSFDASPKTWIQALAAGISAITRYGGAEPGDRTMLDALQPACDVLKKNENSTDLKSVIINAAKAAVQGAEATATMQAHAGRASYVAQNQLKNPDPGAHAVGIWMSAIARALAH